MLDHRIPPASVTDRLDGPVGFAVVVRPDCDRVIVAPRGELDLATAGELDAVLDELVADGWTALVLDLRGLTFIDSTGLTLVVRRARRDDAHVAIVDGTGRVARIFDVTETRSTLPFVDAREGGRRL